MGRQIYLTDKEIEALKDTASEWCQIMEDGEETVQDTQDRLNNGLGSALYKLYNNGWYKDYIKK